ncbi:hypothetical protein F3K34_01440 [Streptomyces sp. LBUM 1486]|nr:hypothetical protein [Streptomyces sp. LBUM 1486]QTU58784.1 hypothetical protein F3K21_01440 [Streptomyces sp. LBUM 1480]
MITQAPGTSPQEKEGLERERDRQIRETAVDTLHPAGIAPERLHPDGIPDTGPTTAKGKGKGRSTASDFAAKDARGPRDAHQGPAHPAERAEAVRPEGGDPRGRLRQGRHPGPRPRRGVNLRIPALRSADEPAFSLPEFLGVIQDDRTNTRAGDVIDRGFATHRTSITANKEGKPGAFKEKGGPLASVTNMVSVGADRPDLWGQNLSGGGLGSKDWNGDVVLSDGTHGHMLLVHHRPTTRKDGSLQIGIETLAPHATSPVGYEHGFRSTEATANPESVLHGHKGDKIGSGGLGKNERLVELAEMGAAHSSGDWRTFLDEIKKQWDAAPAETEDGSPARRALYENLLGPRARPKP